MRNIDRHDIANAPVQAPTRTKTRATTKVATSASRPNAAHAMVGRRLADVERDLVLATLARCAGNRTWAADILGLAPMELRDRLLGYGRDAEKEARAMARREAVLAADMTAGPRPTYVPSPTLLA